MAYKPQLVGIVGPGKLYPLSAAAAAEKAIGMTLDATANPAVGAPGSATVTLTILDGDLGGVNAGDLAVCDTGAAYEVAPITAVNIPAGQITATFAKTHAANFAVRVSHGTFLNGIAIPQIGTAMTLSLYNGHPSAPGAAPFFTWVTAAGAVPPHLFAGVCDRGLYAVYAGTTPGFVSLTALAMVR
ncbi:MAG TPA: hypothetical protein VF116_22675 [Ktedonobacterales bacterium]